MTTFFNEPDQLEYLVHHAVPELIRSFGHGVKRRLFIWVAGCSRGEEPYGIAMALKEFSDRFPGIGFDFLILATDSEPEALLDAERAIYSEEAIEPVPAGFRKRYLMRSRDQEKRLVRVAPEVRDCVKFRQLDPGRDNPGFREPVDIIFCRGLLGSADQARKATLLEQFSNHLSPGGYLFIGPSEAAADPGFQLVPVTPATFRKPGGE